MPLGTHLSSLEIRDSLRAGPPSLSPLPTMPGSQKVQVVESVSLFIIGSMCAHRHRGLKCYCFCWREWTRDAPRFMDNTIFVVLKTAVWKSANLGSSNGFAFGSHVNFVLQLPHMSLRRNVVTLLTEVTVSSNAEEITFHTQPSPLNSTHLLGSFSMPLASRSLSLPYRVMEFPSSQRIKSLAYTSSWI